MKKIAIIGLGLIGGSLAIELKKYYHAYIIGIDNDEMHLNKSIELGFVDEAGSLPNISSCNLVIIATPVNIIPILAIEILNSISPDTLVIDVGSTKATICNALSHHPKRENYVATHPIAGTEFSGPTAAIPNLFKNKVLIICEKHLSSAALLEKTIQLFENLQMRITFIDDADVHDKQIAYVSHLSHISSFMLGKTVLEKENNENTIFNMAGSGFESTVRLAKSSPKTWTPIFMQNKNNILESLDEYIKNLTLFKDLLVNEDDQQVFEVMKNTNRIKDVLSGINKIKTI